MIAVLLASARVASGSLQMSATIGADPHVVVRGRDRKAGNTGELRGCNQRAIVGPDIGKVVALSQPADAGVGVGHVDESGRDSHFRRLRHRLLIAIVTCDLACRRSALIRGRRTPTSLTRAGPGSLLTAATSLSPIAVFHETPYLA